MPIQTVNPSRSQDHPTTLNTDASGRAYAMYWQQLAASISKIQADPSLAEPRFEQVEALIGLGLSTLSLRECDRLDQATDQQSRVDDLKQLISKLGDDRISIEERETNLRLNLARIAEQVPVDEEQVDQWRSAAREISWYRSFDGNIVRCNEQRGRIAHLADTRTLHLKTMSPLIEQLKQKRLPPILLEGLDPHWIFNELLTACPPENYLGFRQRILVLQADWNEFFDGLSCADLGEEVGNPRILWFIGENASSKLLAWYETRIDDVPPTMVIQNPLIRKPAEPDSRVLLKMIDSRWTQSLNSLTQWIASRKPKDQSDLAAKFERVIAQLNKGHRPKTNENPAPLRVLIPTSRYTTYLQHVSRDLAESFTELGCECLVQIESDDSQVFSKNDYLRQIKDFDPDLVVIINNPRVLVSEHSPADIPHVCWIQDAMAHLFDIKIGKSIGPNDFIVGQIKNEFVTQFAYPKEQVKWMPMVASGSKFSQRTSKTHACTPSKYECEIAWVTHQSEHPDLLKSRLVESVQSQSPEMAIKLKTVLDEISQLITTAPHTRFFTEIEQILDAAFFPAGASPENSNAKSVLLNTHIVPYAERVFRHQVAIWASRIADRRGWRLRLYGNGWENHPQLSAYAGGAVEHGDQLAQCYRDATVHLHASVNQVMHQRVSECLLSGGLPLCRPLRDAFALVNNMAIADTIKRGVGKPRLDQSGARDGMFVRLDDCPIAKKRIQELRRLGLCEDHEYRDGVLGWTELKVQAAIKSNKNLIELANAQMFASSTDLFFTTEDQLEALLERAINDKNWRADRIKQGVENMPKEMTMDGFVENLLNFVHAGLSKSS